MNLRDKFHALCKTRGLDASGHIGDWSSDFEYDHSHTQIMWEGFQAGAASRDAEIQRLQMALADAEALELGTAEKCDQLRAHVNRLKEALGKHLTELMDIAVANGANSVSMPDEYVATALLLSSTTEQSLAAYRNKVIDDVERYRWLRGYMASERTDLDDEIVEACSTDKPEKLDAFIDTAIRAMKEQP